MTSARHDQRLSVLATDPTARGSASRRSPASGETARVHRRGVEDSMTEVNSTAADEDDTAVAVPARRPCDVAGPDVLSLYLLHDAQSLRAMALSLVLRERQRQARHALEQIGSRIGAWMVVSFVKAINLHPPRRDRAARRAPAAAPGGRGRPRGRRRCLAARGAPEHPRTFPRPGSVARSPWRRGPRRLRIPPVAHRRSWQVSPRAVVRAFR